MKKRLVLYQLKSWLGTLIYCIGVVYFLRPLNLFAGGFVGISQLLAGLFPTFPGIDADGIIYLVINIPLFILGIIFLGKSFVAKSIGIVVLQSAILTFLPPLNTPILSDMLTGCIVSGVIEGIGAGLVFQSFSSSGGTDILGMLLIKKNPNFKIGYISILINLCVFTVSGFLFSPETAIYSFITLAVEGIVIDYLHKQNRVVTVFIFTENAEEISRYIMETLSRTATRWQATGAYSEEQTNILLVVLSEYEYDILKHQVPLIDEKAFMTAGPGSVGFGDFEKRVNKDIYTKSSKKKKTGRKK